MGRFKDGLAESVTMGSAVFARDYLAPVWQLIHYPSGTLPSAEYQPLHCNYTKPDICDFSLQIQNRQGNCIQYKELHLCAVCKVSDVETFSTSHTSQMRIIVRFLHFCHV